VVSGWMVVFARNLLLEAAIEGNSPRSVRIKNLEVSEQLREQ